MVRRDRMLRRDAREKRAQLLPAIGVSLPVSLIRAGMGVAMIGLSFGEFGFSTLLFVAVAGAAAVLLFPRPPFAWMFVLLFAVPFVQVPPTGPSWQLALAIAGTHTLHEFGMMSGWLPQRGRVQRAVLGRMLRSWLFIEIPVQAVALGIILVVTGTSISTALASPVFGVIAALCLLGLVILVLVPILRGSRPD